MVSIEKIISYWYLSLKDRNVVETIRWVWEDSSLSIFIGGRGRFSRSFISGCNMDPPNPRICFIGQQKVDPRRTFLSPVRRSPYKIDNFRGIHKLLTRFSKFRTGSSKIGCNMEHSRKVCKNLIYRRQFGLILRQTWATREHIPPVLFDPVCNSTTHLRRYAGSSLQHNRCVHTTGSPLILQVSAERAYWC